MDENEEGENETCIGRVILPLSNFVRGNLTVRRGEEEREGAGEEGRKGE
jgi:hypothetical protein